MFLRKKNKENVKIHFSANEIKNIDIEVFFKKCKKDLKKVKK